MSGDFGVDDNNKQNQYHFLLSLLEITFSSPSLQISTVSVNLWWIKEYKSSLVLTWRITEHISFSCMYRWFVSDVTVLLEASLTILLLSWDIVGNVCVVTLLREPEMTMITVMVTPVMMILWTCAHISLCFPKPSLQPDQRIWWQLGFLWTERSYLHHFLNASHFLFSFSFDAVGHRFFFAHIDLRAIHLNRWEVKADDNWKQFKGKWRLTCLTLPCLSRSIWSSAPSRSRNW